MLLYNFNKNYIHAVFTPNDVTLLHCVVGYYGQPGQLQQLVASRTQLSVSMCRPMQVLTSRVIAEQCFGSITYPAISVYVSANASLDQQGNSRAVFW